jgi:16S rRNA (cytosine1402-N4)-methyltransferase
VDRDPDAIRIARARLGDEGMSYVQDSFGGPDARDAIEAFRPDTILLDLGVSSRQLDETDRGFSFRPGAPLDMRMERDGPTAADLLNGSSQQEIRQWLSDWGDEPRALRVAGEIVRRRERAPFATSDDLVNAIRAVLGPRSGPDDFARIFQAIRIAVNDELAGLETALPWLRDALAPDGLLAILSYHSGEDRVVKHAFHEWSRACICPPTQPVCTCRGRALGRAAPRGGSVPAPDEIEANPRARSARLRLFRATG